MRGYRYRGMLAGIAGKLVATADAFAFSENLIIQLGYYYGPRWSTFVLAVFRDGFSPYRGERLSAAGTQFMFTRLAGREQYEEA